MRNLPREARVIICLLIAIVPINIVRVLLHRFVNRYQISLHARIGFGTLLLVDEARIGRAGIGKLNRFDGPFSLVIDDGASIGPFNSFICVRLGAEKQPAFGKYMRYCRIGSNTLITQSHVIDATGGFELGSNSWLAGCGSQFWSHGIENAPVSIGSDCYVCSAVRFTPGSSVANRVLVAVGSVVTKKFEQDGVMIGGVPASIIRDN